MAFTALFTITLTAPPACAQAFTVLHNFTGDSDGGNPLAGLTIDKNGNLYGTAEMGGSLGYGTAFELQRSGSNWTFVPLHNFASGTDGSYPTSRLMLGPKGEALYGVTSGGGNAGGQGTVFMLTPGPVETVIYRFTDGTSSGTAPSCNLVFDPEGNLYGTTISGGANGFGTVFKLVKPAQQGGAWAQEVLHTFTGGADGANPVAGLTSDSKGVLYGTTSAGGTAGYGTVFQMTYSQSGWTKTILHSFENAGDGSVPYGGLIFDKAGNLYGAATQGGSGGDDGGGTVYQLKPSSSGWTFNVIYAVPGWGISGPYRNLYMDAAGNIYGTTHCDGLNSAGSVFKLINSGGTWSYTDLHDFDVSDGQYVFSSLVFDQQGNLYGTTQIGGASGYGVIWEITP